MHLSFCFLLVLTGEGAVSSAPHACLDGTSCPTKESPAEGGDEIAFLQTTHDVRRYVQRPEPTAVVERMTGVGALAQLVVQEGAQLGRHAETFNASDAKMADVNTCGGTANGAPCQFPFTYQNTEYTSCTSDNHDEPWCGTTTVYDGTWGNCICSEEVNTCGGTANGAQCHFPFTYENTEYTSCTSDNHDEPWCGTTRVYDGTWGNCLCEDDTPPVAAAPAPTVNTCGGTANGAQCHFPFTFENTEYTSCTSDNHDEPWCATTRVYDGTWGNCLCEDDAPPEAPAPAPLPVPPQAPLPVPPQEEDNACCEAMTAECQACILGRPGMPEFVFCMEFGHDFPEICEASA